MTDQLTSFCAECRKRITVVDDAWVHNDRRIQDHVALQETEEQAAARILEWRCSKALSGAADVALHVRSLALNGVSEAGETLPEWSAPMRITATDDVDAMFAQLVNWVGFWSEVLDSAPPSTAVVAWSNFKEVQGFKAGTTPEGAHLLVQLQALWLNTRAERMEGHESVTVYREDVVQLLGNLRGRYPLAARPAKPISLRPCPLCGVAAVSAEWETADVMDVTVQCDDCGHVIPTPRPSDVAKWLPDYSSRIVVSEPCDAGTHTKCESLECDCRCHER